MSKEMIKGGLLGGVVIFVWSAISWMILPWHMTTMYSFKSDVAMSQAFAANVSQSGIYMMPAQTIMAAHIVTPLVFASVYLPGMSSMWPAMIIQLIIQIVSAFLVMGLLAKTALTYWGRVRFVTIFGVALAIGAYLPYWNWFCFSTGYTLVGMFDLVVAWFLAGVVMARCMRNSA